jgi:YspA, cpYpsA-related SLOG family
VRILITGSREFADREMIRNALLAAVLVYSRPGEEVTVITGTSPRRFPAGKNADRIAAEEAAKLGFAVEVHEADWDGPCRPECRHGPRRVHRYGGEYCPVAGNYRNQVMVDSGADTCLAFLQAGAGNRGTSDCCERAGKAGIPVQRYWGGEGDDEPAPGAA